MTSRICILTAGRGTRTGAYSTIVNKTLLPVDRKAVISHIIDKFPADAEFVIGLGFLKDQVRSYLEIAHPFTKFIFVSVENFSGPGSGPGLSLQYCSKHLQRPFYFVSCDTLWEEDVDLKATEDWFAVATVPAGESDQYCNFEIRDDCIVGVRDKEHVEGPTFKAFVGLCHIRNYGAFWEGISREGTVNQESSISKGIGAIIESRRALAKTVTWSDVGTFKRYREIASRYESYDFSKINEFLYIVGGKVIKMFYDASITEKRVRKARLRSGVFPVIVDQQNQFYSYYLEPGKTLYEELDSQIFSDLLSFLDRELWRSSDVPQAEMRESCRKFYYDKTMERLALYREKYALEDVPTVVNGVDIGTTASLLEVIPWEVLFDGKPAFTHGDLQFDNILFNRDTGKFTLLDWRQDFAGRVDSGDVYYDLAKLYGGILLNYAQIKANRFSYLEENSDIRYEIPKTDTSYVAQLEDFITSRGLDVRKVRVLVGLIYLNMSPLHHFPFDKLLYSLARLTLSKELTPGRLHD